MKKKTEFLVLYNKDKNDVRFVEKANNLRIDDLMYQGYEIISHGRCKDVDELNRGVCSNIRAMYEYEHRQNTELKIQLEKALQILKDINRLSASDEGRSIRETHKPFNGDIFKKLGVDFNIEPAPGFRCDISKHFEHLKENVKKIVKNYSLEELDKTFSKMEALELLYNGSCMDKETLKSFFEETN